MPVVAPSPASRPRKHDAFSELRRAEIVAAAVRLFGRKGFQATRAEDIAAAARIAKGTLYLYFKSKEAIYSAAVQHAIRELQGEIAERSAGATDFERRLEAAIRVRLEFWIEHDALYRLLMTLGREAKHRRQTNEVLRLAQAGFLEIFTDAAHAGRIEERDFTALSWAALDLVRGANERRMDRVSDTTPQQDAEWILGCLLRQVQRRPEAA